MLTDRKKTEHKLFLTKDYSITDRWKTNRWIYNIICADVYPVDTMVDILEVR